MTKYIFGIGCLAISILCFLKCFEIEDIYTVLGTIFIMLGNIFFNMKREK